MLTVSSDLTAAMRAARRIPALSVTVEPSRFAVPVLRVDSLGDTTADADAHLSICVDPTQESELLAVRNNGGALDYHPQFPTNAWSNLDTVSAGQGFQLAWDTGGSEFGLAYGDGNSVKFVTSPDGVAWNTPSTIVTEASAIGAVALAFDDAGDACIFYVVGTSTTLKRLRRTSGSWAASGTTWSKSASVANLTGLSASWHSDYVLAVTGTEVTTVNPRLWAVKMGDQFLAPNAWTGLRAIAEADAASGVTFGYPSILEVSGVYFAAFQRDESGDVSTNRAFVAHCMPSAGPLSWWSEPRPIPGATTTHGAALTLYPRGSDTHSTVMIASARRAYYAQFWDGPDLSARVAALSWKLTPDSLRVRLELDNIDGNAIGEGPTTAPLRIGDDVVIAHGYQLADGSTEYGATLRVNVRKLADQLQPGKRRLIVEAVGPWEALDTFRAVDAWTAPAATTRGAIFQRVAALAGIEVGEASGDRAPSTAWSTDAPAFAIAAGEKGSTTLRRLLEETPDFIRPAFGGGFEICAFDDTDYHEQYAIPQFVISSPTRMPLLEMELSDELAVNWTRLQGPDRYADDFEEEQDQYRDLLARPPFAFLVRDQDADDDTKAASRAAHARKRALQLVSTGRAVSTAHPAHELFDIVRLLYKASETDGLEQDYRRVIGIALDYRAGPAGRAAYTTTLDLAKYDVFL